jgi:transposase
MYARREIYRIAVKRLCARYGVIGIEDTNWTAIKRRENSAGEANAIGMATGRWRDLAAPGALLQELRREAARAGAKISAYDGASTWPCHACGAVAPPEDRSRLVHTCPKCSATWDQDVNAAINLRAAAIASAPVPPGQGGPFAPDLGNGANGLDDAA